MDTMAWIPRNGTAAPRPVDVQSALDLLEGLATQRQDPKLLLKVGALRGAYGVYSHTGDAVILEQIIIDLILLLQDGLLASYQVQQIPRDPEESITAEELIEDYLNTKAYKENTRNIYASCLRSVLEKLGEPEDMQAYAGKIEAHMRGNTYNHNTQSAINGLLKHIRKSY